MTNDDLVLDDPVGQSLGGRHAHLARRVGRASTYLTEVATFSSVSADPSPEDWDDWPTCSVRVPSPTCSIVRPLRLRVGSRSSVLKAVR